MARKNACYQCEKRSAECHATCEEYQEYFRKREEYRKKMFEKIILDPLKGYRKACGFADTDPSKQVVFDIFSL